MLRLRLFILCCLSFPAVASELIVEAGKSLTITAAQQNLHVNTLRLGDGATIRFAPDVERWVLIADRAVIGKDVLIDGSGAQGPAGDDGEGQSGTTAEHCQEGAEGGRGESGDDGVRGVKMSLQLGLMSLGGLQLITDGGKGGEGGAGGGGGDAGSIDRCGSKNGGDGGAGGKGGSGGDAGDIQLLYWPAAKTINISQVTSLITTSAQGGVAGAAGIGGQPGTGSEAITINQRTLTGDRKLIPAGKAGKIGELGAAGAMGRKGEVIVGPRLDALTESSGAVQAPSKREEDSAAEVEQMRTELKRLQERIDAMEKRGN